MEKRPFIILAGPTAVGKSALSISLAKAVGGEIISCDSMQVYQYMDIGSAKITPEEMQGVPHYLVDVLPPTEDFHVARFVSMAKEAMEQIYANGHIPIAVGGTGFYIQALLYDADFSEEEHTPIREALEQEARTLGAETLHHRLKEVDPLSAERIHPNNVKRTIRAVEFYELHHEPISLHNQQQKEKTSPYEFCYFVLNDERQHLYDQIDKRVDQMMEMGLYQEVERLRDMGCTRDMVSMQGLGYKELFDVMDGSMTLAEGIYTIKRDTRHFAKRQLTWFRSKPEVIWVNKPDFHYDEQAMLRFMISKIEQKHLR